MQPEIIVLITIVASLGGLMGTFSGLVPGIHVNTLSAMMLASYVPMTEMLSSFVPDGLAGICVASCIFSASIVHTFVDFVPSVFIGAPDPDAVVGALPGHRLLMDGRGMAAVRSAAIGSCIGACASTLISIPLQYALFSGLVRELDAVTWIVLLVAISMMVLHEREPRGMFWAMVCIVISGILGLICMDADIPTTGIVMDSTLLFPLLSGLFGMPALLQSMENTRLTEQKDDVTYPVGIIPGIKGLFTGTLTGWFPGITSTTGAVISNTITPERTPEGFVSMTASIGTAASVMMLTTMSVTGSGRSGATVIVAEILGEGIIGLMNGNYVALLLTAAVASFIGYNMTIVCGKIMVRFVERIETRVLSISCIILIAALVILFTGPYGVMVLLFATVVGFLPMEFGIGRIHLTGCLILPTFLSSIGIRDLVLSIIL